VVAGNVGLERNGSWHAVEVYRRAGPFRLRCGLRRTRRYFELADALKSLVKLAIKRKQLNEQVSELTTNRLSVYLRCLNELDAAGVKTVSSQTLAQQFQLNAAQIRKDLAYFGEFGVRGVGYYVKDLKRHLRQILG